MLPNDRTIKGERNFNLVKKTGKAFNSTSFTLLVYRRPDNSLTKFGFVISNKVDKLAVHRNRVKRAMREAVRQTMLTLPNGFDVVFIAKTPILKLTTEQIMKEIKDYLTNTPLFS